MFLNLSACQLLQDPTTRLGTRRLVPALVTRRPVVSPPPLARQVRHRCCDADVVVPDQSIIVGIEEAAEASTLQTQP
eukprot:5080340-Pleurochrysis_carterae.AAC.1